MTKKNPAFEDPNYWRYQKLVERTSEIIKTNEVVKADSDMLLSVVANVVKKAYLMGVEDSGKEVTAKDFEAIVIDIGNNICIKTQGILN